MLISDLLFFLVLDQLDSCWNAKVQIERSVLGNNILVVPIVWIEELLRRHWCILRDHASANRKHTQYNTFFNSNYEINESYFNIIILKIHKNSLRIISPLWNVDFSIAMRPVKLLHTLGGSAQRTKDLKVFAEKWKWQIDFFSLFATWNAVFLINDALDLVDCAWNQYIRITYCISKIKWNENLLS